MECNEAGPDSGLLVMLEKKELGALDEGGVGAGAG
jgi:hypothetical protein